MHPALCLYLLHTKFHFKKKIVDFLRAVTVDIDDIHHELKLFHVCYPLNHKLAGISNVCH